MDLSFPISASKIHFKSILVLHFLAMVLCVFLCGLSFFLPLAIALIGLSYYWSLQEWKRLSRWHHLKLSFGRITLYRQLSDEGISFQIGQDIFLTPQLTILPLKSKKGKKLYLPIFSDSAASNDFRRLRQYLTVRPKVKKSGLI